MSDIVLQDLEQGLLTITMNRPDRRNALNADMVSGLIAAARRAADDAAVRAVLLKGAGGTFCGGGARAALIAQVSHLAARYRDEIAGIEINPVLVHPEGGGATIVDALVAPSAGVSLKVSAP